MKHLNQNTFGNDVSSQGDFTQTQEFTINQAMAHLVFTTIHRIVNTIPLDIIHNAMLILSNGDHAVVYHLIRTLRDMQKFRFGWNNVNDIYGDCQRQIVIKSSGLIQVINTGTLSILSAAPTQITVPAATSFANTFSDPVWYSDTITYGPLTDGRITMRPRKS